MSTVEPNARRIAGILLGGILLCLPIHAAADDKVEPGSNVKIAEGPNRTIEGIQPEPVVVFEHEGYFRFRWDMFGNRHLFAAPTLGDTGLLPPLSQNGQHSGLLSSSERNGHITAGANLRLRWEPSIIAGERFSLNSQVDILDNLVMGSTPSYHPDSAETPLAFLSESQMSPSDGDSSLVDAVRVKRAWMTWKLANTLHISGGRMPNHWGMGMVYNDGSCEDCDFGDNIDRLSFAAEFMDIRTVLAYDYSVSGVLFGEGGISSGQPVDATRVDDVMQFTWDVLSGDSKPAVGTKAAPTAFRWGWRNVWRTQDGATDIQEEIQTIPGCSGKDDPISPYPALNAAQDPQCVIIRRRDAWIWTTDLHFLVDHRLDAEEHLRFEAELAGVLMGEIARTQGLETVASDKELWSTGAVFRGSYLRPQQEYNLEFGLATGDEMGAFGVLDQSTVAVTDAVYQDAEGLRYRKNNILSSFLFNRAYTIDMMLFRETVGAVTNTLYVKPWTKIQIAEVDGVSIGSRLDVLYAAAMMPSGTPGKGANLGVEPDLQFFLEVPGVFRAVAEGGVLFPLDGLDSFETGRKADPAWTMQGRLHIAF